MNKIRWLIASIMMSFAVFGASATEGTANPPEPSIVWGTCSVCHGEDGIGSRASFPNLAGQTQPYLEAELNDFRDHTRADHDAKAYMWSMAGGLSPKTFSQVAQYYSALKPPGPNHENATEIAAGQKIFEHGISSESMTACQTCHGAQAVGNNVFPRLAGQHRDYLVAQLKAFRSNARDNPIMHPIVERATDGQIRDVAAYLASL